MKEGISQERWKCSKETKNDNAGSEIWIEGSGIIEDIANCGAVDTTTIWETLDMQPQELSEGKLFHTNEGSGCDEKDAVIPEGVILAKISH